MSVPSTSAHPLRQTSFPPDELRGAGDSFDARSPSVDSMSLVSGSQVSGAASRGKKRGRKSKVEKAREQTPSAAPTAGAGAGDGAQTTISGASDSIVRGSGQKGAKGAPGEEDEEEVEVAATAQERTAEQKAEEHRLRGMLINAFTPEQFDRYENWRAAGVSKSAVKRVSSNGRNLLPRKKHTFAICRTR